MCTEHPKNATGKDRKSYGRKECFQTPKKKTPDEIIALIVVIMLGVTALFTAWGSWIGSLHGGNQATSYTTSNNLASEGNSEYNAGVQQMNRDMLLWNDISDMQMEISFAQNNGDDVTVEKICYQLFYKLDENLTERMAGAIGWNYTMSEAEYSDPMGILKQPTICWPSRRKPWRSVKKPMPTAMPMVWSR